MRLLHPRKCPHWIMKTVKKHDTYKCFMCGAYVYKQFAQPKYVKHY